MLLNSFLSCSLYVVYYACFKDYWKFCVTATAVLLTLALSAEQIYGRQLFLSKQKNHHSYFFNSQSGSSHSPLCPWQNDKLRCSALTLQEVLGP